MIGCAPEHLLQKDAEHEEKRIENFDRSIEIDRLHNFELFVEWNKEVLSNSASDGLLSQSLLAETSRERGFRKCCQLSKRQYAPSSKRCGLLFGEIKSREWQRSERCTFLSPID